MICPACGHEVPEGLMYCDVCGREFLMVPAYEPEIEGQIDSTLSRLAQKIDRENEPGRSGQKTGKNVSRAKEARRKRELRKKKERRRKILLVSGGAALVLLVIILIVMRVHKSTADYIRLANRALANGDSAQAIDYLRSAREADPRNTEVIFLLADTLRETGDPEGSLRELDVIVNSAAFDELDLKRAYRDTAQLYLSMGDTASLATLMNRCPFQDIREVYMVAVPDEPLITPPGGAYEDTVEITLSSPEGVRLYYTLDGTLPDENALLYEGPFRISESGTYRLQAVAVTEGGVRSSVTGAEYRVEPRLVEAPRVTKESGYYTSQTQITVSASPGLTIHYTVSEKEMPTLDSPVYQEPIDMPQGDSFFNFVCADENGNLSEVISRQYHLTLNRAISREQAAARVKDALMRIGVIRDVTGATEGADGVLEFEVENLITINGEEYYYIREYRVIGGNREATGLLYAVHTETGFTSRLGIENGQYVLNPGL